MIILVGTEDLIPWVKMFQRREEMRGERERGGEGQLCRELGQQSIVALSIQSSVNELADL